MGCMLPSLLCPRELVHLWWKPVEKAGFHIRDLLLSTKNLIDFQRSPDNLSEVFLDPSSRGIVSYGDVEIVVAVSSDANLPLFLRMGEPSYYMNCLLDNRTKITSEAIDLMTSLLRIFVTSGAHHEDGWKGWKRLYQCATYDFLLKWWEKLPIEGFDVLDNRSNNSLANNTSGQLRFFPEGKVISSQSSVLIHTGPGINPFTGSDRFYVAFDYNDSLFKRHGNHALTKKLEQALIDAGGAYLVERETIESE